MPAGPLCHARRPSLSCPQALSVMPAGTSVIPAVFSGNPVKTVLLQGSIGRHTPSGKAITAEWRAPWCRTVNEGNIQQEKTMDSRLQTSGMTEGVSGITRQPIGHRSHQALDSRLRTSGMTEGAGDVLNENHEATGFVPPNGHNPAHPLPVIPAAPPRHTRRPSPSCPPPLPVMPAAPPRYARRLLPVMPAGTSLSCPQSPSVIPAGFSGNPVKTVLLQGSIGRHTPSARRA